MVGGAVGVPDAVSRRIVPTASVGRHDIVLTDMVYWMHR